MRRIAGGWLALVVVSLASAAPKPAIYLGGASDVSIAKIAADAAGNVYAIGSELHTIGTYSAHTVYVTKVDPNGTTLYTTRLSGKGDDLGLGIAVDAAGRVFGCGSTTSPDFPLVHAIQTGTADRGSTGFVFSLDPSGAVRWSSYFGGDGAGQGSIGSVVNAVAVDNFSNVYLTGRSQLLNFPVTAGAYQTDGHFGTQKGEFSNSFVTKLNSEGQIVYSTWLSGSLVDCRINHCFSSTLKRDVGTAIAVDAAGNAVVTGYTNSSDFPVTVGASETTFPTSSILVVSPDATIPSARFLSKIDASGKSLVYSSFLGLVADFSLAGGEINSYLALDSSGAAYAVELSAGTGSPLPPARLGGDYLLRFDPSGNVSIVSRLFGGTTSALAVDHQGEVLVAGHELFLFVDDKAIFDANQIARFSIGSSGGSPIVLPKGFAVKDLAVVPYSPGQLAAVGTSGQLIRMDSFASSAIPPLISAANAASGKIDTGFVPDEIVSFYGTGIGPAQPVVAKPTPKDRLTDSYPESLSGVTVTVNNLPCALLYASSDQINLVMPSQLLSPILVRITNNQGVLGPFVIGAAAAAPKPGIFPVVLNQDGTVNGVLNFAPSGSIVSLWGSGIPALAPHGAEGGAVPKIATDLKTAGLVRLLADGAPLEITYAGAAPGAVGGVFQINARVPNQNGFFQLQLEAGGVKSPAITVYVDANFLHAI